MKHREAIISVLKPFFIELPDVLAVWEAGSKATGFVDEYSDIDLYVTVKDESVETTFQKLDDLLSKKYGIVRKFRIPEPSWHGASQTFYQLRYGPSYFYLDVAVFKLSNPNKFMEQDRHGIADVWFDRQNIYDDTPTPQDIVIKKNKAFYQSIIASDFITMLEVEKAIYRNNYLDAFPFYYAFISRNVVGLLNIQYRPEKYDFGMRYLSRTFSQKDADLIKDALGVHNIDELKHHYEILKQRYELAKHELRHLGQ